MYKLNKDQKAAFLRRAYKEMNEAYSLLTDNGFKDVIMLFEAGLSLKNKRFWKELANSKES